MKIQSIKVKNFKAISEANLLGLSQFNVLVGANGSGKSSVLQALHWIFQSGRNPKVKANRKNTEGSTLSMLEATYTPSSDYQDAGHSGEFGNFQGAPRLDVEVEAIDPSGAAIRAAMWIKLARNEGISVHVPSANEFVATVRDRKREFSAYIPGLAGIPLSEEKRSKRIVQKQAAAGDANTVLRNILHLLHLLKIDGGRTGLDEVQRLASRVIGNLTLNVIFDDEDDYRIKAEFQTAQMKAADAKRFKPLELAGIGYLQVIQIFSYLVYFRPVLLLVDEPDAHLHPDAQERLVNVLSDAAKRFGCQVIMTTHSPSVVRALPTDARVIWMKDGSVQQGGTEVARQQMGWGLLDKKVLLLTEDTGTDKLRAILSQWPEIERATAVWPLHGTGKIPAPEAIASLRELFGGHLKVVLHRDGDFMMPAERQAYAEPYSEKDIHVWVTEQSDIESYWADSAIIAAHFNLTLAEAEQMLTEVCDELEVGPNAATTRRTKRHDCLNKINKKGAIPHYGDAEVEAALMLAGRQHLHLGKTLVRRLREVAKDRKLAEVNQFGKCIPDGLTACLAPELKLVIEKGLP